MRTNRSLAVRTAVTLAASALVAVAVGFASRPTARAVAVGAHRQAATASGQGVDTTVRVTKPATGAVLVVCVGADVAVDAVTDDAGSTYALVTSVANSSGAGRLSVYEARPARPARPASTVTVRHAWGNASVVVSEYAGLRGGAERSAARDAGYDTGGAWSSGPTARTRRAGSMVIGCAFDVHAAAAPVAFAPGAGFTARATAGGVFLEDRFVSRAGRFEATGTRTPADRRNVVAAVVTYATGRPASTPPTSAAPTTAVPSTTAAPPPTVAPTTVAPTTVAPTTVAPPTTAALPTTVAPPTTAAPPLVGPVQLLFADVTSGPTAGGPDGLGVPIALYGKGFGATRGPGRVTIGGVEVARYVSWGGGGAQNPELERIVVQPGPAVTGGQVVVTTGAGSSSDPVSFTVDAAARLFEVARSGDDARSCRWGEPCASILRTVSAMGPGDIALVRGGEYDESEIWIRGDHGMSGVPGRQKVVKAAAGEAVVLTNAARPFIVDADHVTIAGLEFRDGKSLGIPDRGLPGRQGNRFIDNAFSGTISWAAIDSHGDGHELAGNRCEVSGSTVGTQGHCYYVSYGRGLRLRYNVGAGAPGYGIHLFDQQRATDDFRRVITDVLIEGNTLRGSSLRSGLIIAMSDEGGRGNLIDGVVVRGNTFAANSHLGVLVSGRVRNVTITANTFVENGRQGVHVGAGVTGVAITGNEITQAGAANCRNDCSWYATAHIEVEPGAQVTVRDNVYRPAPPLVLGATDPAPR